MDWYYEAVPNQQVLELLTNLSALENSTTLWFNDWIGIATTAISSTQKTPSVPFFLSFFEIEISFLVQQLQPMLH